MTKDRRSLDENSFQPRVSEKKENQSLLSEPQEEETESAVNGKPASVQIDAASTAAKPRRVIGRPFVKGQPSANPKGRGKGTRDRFGRLLMSLCTDALRKHGAETLEKVREKKPHEWLKVMATLAPKQLEVEARIGPTHEERVSLAARLAELEAENAQKQPILLEARKVEED
jgi:hypothetical protein